MFALDVAAQGTPIAEYTDAGKAMLTVLVPYAAIVVLALGAYAVLGWRKKYIAMAVVLGPFTLVRPRVAMVAGFAGVSASESGSAVASIALAVIAVQVVEPLANRRWSKGR
jgi:hypothetical protein